MTDIKRFSHVASPIPDRTVSVLLGPWLSPQSSDIYAERPMAGTTLLARARELLGRIAETDKKLTWQDEPAFPLCTSHVLLLSPLCPFLRPSSIDEAIRLFNVRFDIDDMISCVRFDSTIVDQKGVASLEQPQGQQGGKAGPLCSPLYQIIPAFRLMPRDKLGLFDLQSDYPFELSKTEGFCIQSEFEFELADARLRLKMSPS